jgi:hypothetical protein
VIISRETVRGCIPQAHDGIMDSSGYFVYDEQYVHIEGKEKHRALLKDAKNGNFCENILDDLKESTLVDFFVRSLSRFNIPNHIFITKDGYHYYSILKEAAKRSLDHKEKSLDDAKRLIKFMFFQTENNMKKIRDHDKLITHIKGKSESEIIDYILTVLRDMYGEDKIIYRFLEFLKRNKNEVFLYLNENQVEKTSDKAEQHFSIMSWLFKNRFKSKEGLLRTSYWYHRYISTGI